MKKFIGVWFFLCFFSGVFAGASLESEKEYAVSRFVFVGLESTNEDWLKDYLGIVLPKAFSQADLNELRSKILTTQVFSQVILNPLLKDDQTYVLYINVKEKWTLIPVLRAQLGGGTPLRVLGFYDTHTFGTLWTVGAEFHRYGSETPGYAIYMKSPPAREGKAAAALEYWRIVRKRPLYDHGYKEFAQASLRGEKKRGTLFLPWSGPLHVGLDLQYQTLNQKFNFKDETSPAGQLPSLVPGLHSQTMLMPTLLLDKIRVDGLQYSGLRSTLKIGALIEEKKTTSISEVELYYYLPFASLYNFAFHFFAGDNQGGDLSSIYFLGGFDSIRGLPDGALWGHQAIYANSELRYLWAQLERLHVQSLIFFDAGATTENRKSWQDANDASIGAGVRLSIPQINRMVIRIDFAKSLRHPQYYGFSLGFNHLFQPYKPLQER